MRVEINGTFHEISNPDNVFQKAFYVPVNYQPFRRNNKILARCAKCGEELGVYYCEDRLYAIAHPASVGHGLNLQEGGHIIIWFGLTWSLELYQQANERLNRPGQTNICRIYHLILQGTHDARVLKALESKDTSQRALIDALKQTMK